MMMESVKSSLRPLLAKRNGKELHEDAQWFRSPSAMQRDICLLLDPSFSATLQDTKVLEGNLMHPSTPSRLWQEMTWPELETLKEEDPVVLVPIGSIEQHGPHLPLDTDSRSIWEVCTRASQAVTEFPVIVAPPLWSGFSPHHMGFPGTITLRYETFTRVIEDVCECIDHHGFHRIVLANGHGGNIAILGALTYKLLEKGIRAASVTYFSLIADKLNEIGTSDLGGMWHACEMETSTLLFFAPHLVRQEQLVKEIVPPAGRFFTTDFRRGGLAQFPMLAKADTKTGVYGDPTAATADKGRAIINAAVAAMRDFLLSFHTLDVSIPGA
jgi:creatinine amidohydrolase